MSEEQKSIKDSIETLNYLMTQLIVELKTLNDSLQNLTLLQANKKLVKQEQEKREDDKGFAGDKQQLMRYLKQKCPTIWADLNDIKEMPSGDFLVTFDYMSSEDFSKAAKEIKEALDGYYSKRYRGFIVPRKKGGKQ